jgi:hypothetical protein
VYSYTDIHVVTTRPSMRTNLPLEAFSKQKQGLPDKTAMNERCYLSGHAVLNKGKCNNLRQLEQGKSS